MDHAISKLKKALAATLAVSVAWMSAPAGAWAAPGRAVRAAKPAVTGGASVRGAAPRTGALASVTAPIASRGASVSRIPAASTRALPSRSTALPSRTVATEIRAVGGTRAAAPRGAAATEVVLPARSVPGRGATNLAVARSLTDASVAHTVFTGGGASARAVGDAAAAVMPAARGSAGGGARSQTAPRRGSLRQASARSQAGPAKSGLAAAPRSMGLLGRRGTVTLAATADPAVPAPSGARSSSKRGSSRIAKVFYATLLVSLIIADLAIGGGYWATKLASGLGTLSIVDLGIIMGYMVVSPALMYLIHDWLSFMPPGLRKFASFILATTAIMAALLFLSVISGSTAALHMDTGAGAAAAPVADPFGGATAAAPAAPAPTGPVFDHGSWREFFYQHFTAYLYSDSVMVPAVATLLPYILTVSGALLLQRLAPPESGN